MSLWAHWSGQWSCRGERIEDVGGPVAEGAVGGGDVGVGAQPDDVDCGVAQGGHDLRAVAGAHAGVVLTLGHVAQQVQAVLGRARAEAKSCGNSLTWAYAGGRGSRGGLEVSNLSITSEK